MEQSKSYFSKLPDELLVKICNNMDNATLAKFISSYGRVYQVCSYILDNRKHERQLTIAKYKNILFKNKRITIGLVDPKLPSDWKVGVLVYPSGNGYTLYQSITVPIGVKHDIPWILPSISYRERLIDYDFSNTGTRLVTITTRIGKFLPYMLDTVLDKLYDLGYRHIVKP